MAKQGNPADDLGFPLVICAVGDGSGRKASTLVRDSTPELTGIPPPFVTGICPQYQEYTKCSSSDFIGGDPDFDGKMSHPVQDESKHGDHDEWNCGPDNVPEIMPP